FALVAVVSREMLGGAAPLVNYRSPARALLREPFLASIAHSSTSHTSAESRRAGSSGGCNRANKAQFLDHCGDCFCRLGGRGAVSPDRTAEDARVGCQLQPGDDLEFGKGRRGPER